MLLQAEQMHKITSISLKMFKGVILSGNNNYFLLSLSRVKWDNSRNEDLVDTLSNLVNEFNVCWMTQYIYIYGQLIPNQPIRNGMYQS